MIVFEGELSSVFKLKVSVFFDICYFDVDWRDVVYFCCNPLYFKAGVHFDVFKSSIAYIRAMPEFIDTDYAAMVDALRRRVST